MKEDKDPLIDKIITALSAPEKLKHVCRNQEEHHPMPSIEKIGRIVNHIRAVIFPGYFGQSSVNPNNVKQHIQESTKEILHLLIAQIKSGKCFENTSLDYNCQQLKKEAQEIAEKFIAYLPTLRELLNLDVQATFDGDPAAKNTGEIIFSYPGIKAISSYRIAHKLHLLQVPILPRVITEMAHSETGIDIHPGATIGSGFMIDHGTGVVIGETAQIGNNVKIYQGVTLGAKSFDTDENGKLIKGIDRHPKIGNNVIIYANSTILGNIHIGDNTIIGGNLWIDKEIPNNAIVVQEKRKIKYIEKK